MSLENKNQFATPAAKLEELGPLAHVAIEKKLAEKTVPLETTRRLKEIARKVKTSLSADELRSLRAVEILTHIGAPESRPVLAELARGADGIPLTEETRRALARSSDVK